MSGREHESKSHGEPSTRGAEGGVPPDQNIQIEKTVKTAMADHAQATTFSGGMWARTQ